MLGWVAIVGSSFLALTYHQKERTCLAACTFWNAIQNIRLM